MSITRWLLAIFLTSLVATPTQAATITFNFAQVGNSYLAFLFGDNPAVGKEVTSARIVLDVESFAGSDAANFYTDIAFPVAPLPGNDGGLSLLGGDLGWSGAGTFHYFEETDRFNGTFISTRFGAETPGQDFDGQILDGSGIEFTYVPEPTCLALLTLGTGVFYFFNAETRRRRGGGRK